MSTNETEVVNDATDGDFFESDSASLEQQLLDSMGEAPDEDADAAVDPDTDSSIDGEEAKPEVEAKPVEGEIDEKVDSPLFDSEGQLNLDKLQGLSDEEKTEIKRGFLREADYTRKTQEIAEQRTAAQEILTGYEQIQKNPASLREYFNDANILSSFTWQEMLNHGLHAAGVPPQAWNEFIGWYKENGENVQQNVPQHDPNALRMDSMERNQQAFQSKYQQQQEQNAQIAQQQQADLEKQENFKAVEAKVSSALEKFSEVTKKELLVEMATSDGSKSIEQMAKVIKDEKDARLDAYIQSKRDAKKKSAKPIKGGTVPVLRKAPQTFEEADGMLDSAYGNGTLGRG